MTFNPSKRQALGRSFVARDSVAATQSTFFGTKAPTEVTQLALSLPNTDQATFIKLLKFVLEYIKGTEITEQHWTKLKESVEEIASADNTAANNNKNTLAKLPLLFAGIYKLLKTALHDRVSPDAFKKDLGILGLQETHIKELTTALVQMRTNLQLIRAPSASTSTSGVRLGILAVDWRIDVSIITSWTRRAVKTTPTILLRITTTDLRHHIFEMTTDKFHQMRFAVARLLKELTTIEGLSVLKIDKK
eukprot:TRINITY_DN12498_c0_g1_i1.p1 TRINITY_DN12498_c0_g1~~TRINITY_DN12498_c0_g1_i1.p1  ORF type:complete len:248 (+),score=60.54 TRINITY_DN12498_c0_g1_i1:53-796(+)